MCIRFFAVILIISVILSCIHNINRTYNFLLPISQKRHEVSDTSISIGKVLKKLK